MCMRLNSGNFAASDDTLNRTLLRRLTVVCVLSESTAVAGKDLNDANDGVRLK